MTTTNPDAGDAMTRPRLDDLFRYAVHLHPEYLHGIVAPDLVVSGPVRTMRLDTQLAPSRLLPDTSYLVETNDRSIIVVSEGQRRTRSVPPERATNIVVDVGSTLAASIGRRPPIRLIEIRTKYRCFPTRSKAAHELGQIRFEPTNVLLDLDPDSPELEDPGCWVFLAFSRRVGPEHIEQRIESLSALLRAPHIPAPNADSMDLYLLGAIGRARFPEYAWSRRTREINMNDIQNIEATNTGQLTPDERHELRRLAIENARREFRRLQAEAEEAGERAGREAGERAGREAGEKAGRQALLDVAAAVAPDETERFRAIESLNELRAAVLQRLNKGR